MLPEAGAWGPRQAFAKFQVSAAEAGSSLRGPPAPDGGVSSGSPVSPRESVARPAGSRVSRQVMNTALERELRVLRGDLGRSCCRGGGWRWADSGPVLEDSEAPVVSRAWEW